MRKNFFSRFPGGSSRNWQDWRWQLRHRAASPAALARILERPRGNRQQMERIIRRYPMAITPYYLSLLEPDHENDPLSLQCIPDVREYSFSAGLANDPLGEDRSMPVPNLIQRYPDRVLAIVTRRCATYCRHCNRKRFWSVPEPGSFKSRLARMIRYVSETPQVREVILSGGDPLLFDDESLEGILSSFSSIPHVEVLRIGSRAPAVLPMRITPNLCRILKRHRPLWFNTQFNHPSEITPDAARACNRIQEAGIPVSNQSVLLKGVNDSAEVMQNLLNGLQKISVRPYYLFHCEPARGCGHFRTDVRTGLALMEKLHRSCSGLALPQYTADLPGPEGKVPLWPLSRSIRSALRKHQDFFDNFE
ncbi:MAG TPA: KamA family radical SAM protein [Smithellaceae bacterium]|nr:KamA family radical SAM protein [Smithellaceae bacterium]HRS82254.1 KamA family radical SAM protein [Smithellaceae bacterium]HRV43860.1 KamA family radical SAM protein [Smithellaceae bacterium]